MKLRVVGLVCLWLLALPAAAQVAISDAWVRAVPPVSDSTAAYFVLHNNGDRPVLLKGATADIAGRAMLHETVVDAQGNGTMKHLPGVEVPAGGEVRFQPRGKHLMLMQLKRVPLAGETVKVCLQVNAEEVCRPFPVRREAP